MFTLLIIIHLLVAFALVLSILLQRGEAGGLSGAFGGGGGNQSLFGGRGAATFLSKATAYLGAAFLVVSFVLALVQAHHVGATVAGRNVFQQTAPATPGTPAGQPGATGGESQTPAQPAPGAQGGGTEQPVLPLGGE